MRILRMVTAINFTIFPTGFAFFFPVCIICPKANASPQYLCTLACNSVIRSNAATGKTINDITLSDRTRFVPPECPRTAFCDLEDMTYHAETHTAVVTVSDRNKRVYRSLTFRIPAFILVASRILPETWYEDGDVTNEPSDKHHENLFASFNIPGLQKGGILAGSLELEGCHGDAPTSCTAYGQGKLLLSEPIAQEGGLALLKVTCADGIHPASVDVRS